MLTVKQAARAYVREQIAIMKRYGSAPKLSRERRAQIVADVERVFRKLRALR